MKTFRRSSFLILALVLSLTACSSQPGNVSNDENPQVEADAGDSSKKDETIDQNQDKQETTEEKVHNDDSESSEKDTSDKDETAEVDETAEENPVSTDQEEGGVGGYVEALDEDSQDTPTTESSIPDESKTNTPDTNKDSNNQSPSKDSQVKDEPQLNNVKLGFNNEESKALRDLVNSLGHSLVEDDNQEVPTIKNVDDLEAIVAFDNDISYGWICKYEDNKIGVAMIYHEVGQNMKPIVVIFGEKTLYESGSSGIMNNYKTRFIQEAEDIKLNFFEPGTHFIDLYK